MHSPLSFVAVAVLAALPVQAQQRPQPLPDGSAVGASAGVFTAGGESLFALSLTASELRAGRASADFSLALSPQALGYGVLLLATDVGPAFNVAMPGITVLLKGGPSVVEHLYFTDRQAASVPSLDGRAHRPAAGLTSRAASSTV